MDTRYNVAQRFVNGAMPGHARLAFECGGADANVEMALATFLKPCMTPVAFAVIHHLKLTRIKGGLQSGSDFVSHSHFYAQRQKTCRPPLLLSAA
jgi:hypothetical protein